MELVRQILLDVDAWPVLGIVYLDIPEHKPQEISYHVMLLREAELLEAVQHTNGQHLWRPTNLTWEGHEFIDALRKDDFWEKVKKFTLETTGTLTVAAIKAVVPIVLVQLATKQ